MYLAPCPQLGAGLAIEHLSVTVLPNQNTVEKLNRLVSEHIFPNRSRAIQEAVQEKFERMERNRLTRECAKLNPAFEMAIAEEGLSEELSKCPKY